MASFQDRAQHTIAQLDKEVSTLLLCVSFASVFGDDTSSTPFHCFYFHIRCPVLAFSFLQ